MENFKTSKATYNNGYRTQFINFTDGTFAKLVTKEVQTLKYKKTVLVEISGDYDKTKTSVSFDEMQGGLCIVPISTKTAEISEILNHSIFGNCEVLEKNEKVMQIKVLKTGEHKSVMTMFFMNNVK